jgi:hypothetical protein
VAITYEEHHHRSLACYRCIGEKSLTEIVGGARLSSELILFGLADTWQMLKRWWILSALGILSASLIFFFSYPRWWSEGFALNLLSELVGVGIELSLVYLLFDNIVERRVAQSAKPARCFFFNLFAENLDDFLSNFHGALEELSIAFQSNSRAILAAVNAWADDPLANHGDQDPCTEIRIHALQKMDGMGAALQALNTAFMISMSSLTPDMLEDGQKVVGVCSNIDKGFKKLLASVSKVDQLAMIDAKSVKDFGTAIDLETIKNNFRDLRKRINALYGDVALGEKAATVLLRIDSVQELMDSAVELISNLITQRMNRPGFAGGSNS